MGKSKAYKQLADWFERQKRVLPWRDEPTLYRVWISEIMLQQTQVVTVVPYFERFLKRFPSVEALARASEPAVMQAWAGLGYYSRARNLHRAARLILERGGFPETRNEWLEIPGVGPYTAGAITSIALNQPEPILDGNVERVLSRMKRVTRAQGDAAYKARLWKLAREAVETAHRERIEPRVLNQALMEIGATVCSPKKPMCMICPLSVDCAAFAMGDPEAFPPAKRKKEWIAVREELHCWIDGDGHVLLRQRKEGEWRAGLWDLMDQRPGRAKLLGVVETKHVVTRHKVTRNTSVWRVASPLRAAENGSDSRWIDAGNPRALATGSALIRTLQRIRERFPEALPRN